MGRSAKRPAGRRASLTVLLAAFSAGAVGAGVVAVSGLGSVAAACLAAAMAALGAGAAAYAFVERIARRLRRIEVFLQTAERGEFLARLPADDEDEAADVEVGINDLLARITTLRVSVIDQGRELRATQEELVLKDALAAKTAELEQRLRERSMLFELLRMSTSKTELDAVVKTLAERVGAALHCRETALILLEPSGKLVVRAAFGFKKPEAVVGFTLEPGEGLTGEVARTGDPIVVQDVSKEPRYRAFDGQAVREGAFAAFPIRYRDKMLGIISLTRGPDHPIGDMELNLLSAIADQAALSIRNAQLFEELRNLSTHDELTKLANRRLLATRLSNELERARRFRQPVSVLAIDIDHFKKLNDRCGHPVGDQALEAVASALETGVRRVDTVARVGGEEFVVVLPAADLQEATKVANKLRTAIGQRQDIPGASSQPAGRLTISLGVAEFDETTDADADALLARADQALYAAKREGRDRAVPWTRLESLAPPVETARTRSAR